jgi:hypothetical protein
MDVRHIYTTYKRNQTPESTINIGEKSTIKSIQSVSKRGDCVIGEHIDEDIYKCIRIIPEFQSRHESIQDHIKNPMKSISKDFKHCSYQLMTVEIPEYRKSDKFKPSSIHRYCQWNSRKATKKRTAMSANQIQKSWRAYLQ